MEATIKEKDEKIQGLIDKIIKMQTPESDDVKQFHSELVCYSDILF